MKNYQFFLIIGLLYDILSNQRTGYIHYITDALSMTFTAISLYYAFWPERDILTVNVKDIQVQTKSN